jgi:hypothetical protein
VSLLRDLLLGSRDCRKCGSSWVEGPRWDPRRDLLIFNCACGYSWTKEPLTKSAPKSGPATPTVEGEVQS